MAARAVTNNDCAENQCEIAMHCCTIPPPLRGTSLYTREALVRCISYALTVTIICGTCEPGELLPIDVKRAIRLESPAAARCFEEIDLYAERMQATGRVSFCPSMPNRVSGPNCRRRLAACKKRGLRRAFCNKKRGEENEKDILNRLIIL